MMTSPIISIKRVRQAGGIVCLSSLLVLVSCSQQPEETSVVGEWPAYGATIGSTKYTDLDQIDASNVSELEIAWRRPALDQHYLELNPQQNYSSTYIATPIMRNGIAYVPNGVGLVEAFNPSTGETIWV